MAIPFSYNFRNVLQRPVSTFTTALGIALTVTIFIGALALAAGFQAALTETGTEDNVIVMRKGADSELTSGVPREASNIIRAHPAIATGPDGRPLVSSEMVVLTNKPRIGQEGSSNLTVRGVDPEAMNLRSNVSIVDGRMFTPGTDEVIVGRRIAPRFEDCAIGDVIRFQQRDFTVVGHFEADGSGFESEIWGDNAALQPALQRGGGFQSITFRMQPAPTDSAAQAQFASLKKELENDPRLAVQVKREKAYYAEQSTALATTIRVIGVLITVIMALGAVFGAMNTMFAAVQARTREIATLLVLGFSPFAVLIAFMAESVLLALLGGILGCVLALPINGIATSTTNFASFSEVAFAFRITPMALVAGLVFAALMGVAGGFLPALKAARQSLASTLRGA